MLRSATIFAGRPADEKIKWLGDIQRKPEREKKRNSGLATFGTSREESFLLPGQTKGRGGFGRTPVPTLY